MIHLIYPFFIGGEKGIRTPGTLLEYTRFPSVPLKPLEHLSFQIFEVQMYKKETYKQNKICFGLLILITKQFSIVIRIYHSVIFHEWL